MDFLPIKISDTKWFKYSKYEIKETEKGIYIIPDLESVRQVYSPFENKDIIRDYLDFGRKCIEGLQTLDKALEALNLAKKYGLLGWYSFNRYDIDSINTDIIIDLYFDDGDFNHEISFEDFLKEFFPFEDRQPIKMSSYSNIDDISKARESFDSNYAEKIGWIVNLAIKMYEHFRSYKDYTRLKQQEIDNMPLSNFFEKHFIASYTIKDIEIKLELGREILFEWKFKSLVDILNIHYATTLISKNLNIGECRKCGSIFIDTNMAKKFCSTSCRSSWNTQMSRKRKAIGAL